MRAKKSTTSKTRSSAKDSGARTGSHCSHRLIDHDAIQQWAEDRGATPSCVKKTGRKGDIGMIRLNFPGYSGEESLQAISWDEWFDQFDESNLALIVHDTAAGGQKSNFNKLVKRSTVEAGEQKPRTRAVG